MPYKAHDPARQARSPYYAAGHEDGARDAALLTSCPGTDPLGMDPERAGSTMYQVGYAKGYGEPMRHEPCPRCAKDAA